MTILLAVSPINLARSARFDITLDGMAHNIPVHHGSNCLFKMGVPRVLGVGGNGLVLILAGAVFYCTVTFQNSSSV
jgi:hypothetical protein